ncbi:MAG: TRAP transporter small permease subunit [Gammaproteobacteria bacterium]|nr:TRAP transporter small permease subunit [Gammaproteobacteria bacterium]
MTSAPAIADPPAGDTPNRSADPAAAQFVPSRATCLLRFLGWCVIGTLAAFLCNVYLNFWQGWPGASQAFAAQADARAPLQLGIWVLAVVLSALFVMLRPRRSLRADAAVMTAIAAYIVRAAFWTVLLVGLADAAVSFLRVEDLLPRLVGEQLAADLGRNQFRGPNLHLPLIVLSFLLAFYARTLGFTWLAMLVVVAELQIVIARFMFSYEQAFMGDLVRFWYAGLFLFASAYTLIEDGHVRVDVLYHGFSQRWRGMVNAIGSMVLGLPLCWVILVIGLGHKTSIITSPLVTLEVTQSGFGMYVKYLMAAQLAVFAVSMSVQFAGYFLTGIADYRGDPGGQPSAPAAAH